MSLAINAEHRDLADSVSSFARSVDSLQLARAALTGEQPDVRLLWKKLAGNGWIGLHVPEEYDGSGFGLTETLVVADELGAGISPSPFLPAVVVAGVLAQVGTDQQRRRHLPSLCAGTTIAALATADDLALSSADRVVGSARGLLGDAAPDIALVRRGDDLIILESGQFSTVLDPAGAIDPSLCFGKVSVSDLPLDPDAVVVGGHRVATQLLRAVLGAEAAGGARAMVEMSRDYAAVREQFGRTIATFQAIKHHLADMLVRSELAAASAWDAGRAYDQAVRKEVDIAQAEIATSAAGLVAPDAYVRNAETNVQVHGGIGFTWEHDAHLYLRRAIALHAIATEGSPSETLVAEMSTGARREIGIDLPEEADAFRGEVRRFVAEYHATPKDQQRRLLAESGYLVPHWPLPWGRAAGPVEQLAIEPELAGVERPNLGITGWVLLTIVQSGTSEQVERWVPQALAGGDVWCQLFSEPGAGSDAAAIRTKGVRVDGGWRVTGQKVWTSGAHVSVRGLATVRTDPDAPKHRGVTAMVIDMSAPGVEIRPLKQITGDSGFNEVFFDDVFVPDEDVVGEINGGWSVARATLGNERVTIGGGLPGRFTAERLLELTPSLSSLDSSVVQEIAALLAEDHALAAINIRQVSRAVVGAGPGPEGNVTKLVGAEHSQRVGALAGKIVGLDLLDGTRDGIARLLLGSRSATIAGGTSEITRNVIAERILGMPRDPLIR